MLLTYNMTIIETHQMIIDSKRNEALQICAYVHASTSENMNKFINCLKILTEMIYGIIGRTYRIVFCYINLSCNVTSKLINTAVVLDAI